MSFAYARSDKRPLKNYMNRLHKKTKPGMFFIDCRYHPCRVVERHLYSHKLDGDIQGVSMFDGSPSGCSMAHCGPEPITPSEAEAMVATHKAEGFYAYLQNHRGFTDADIAEFKKLDEQWNFNKG